MNTQIIDGVEYRWVEAEAGNKITRQPHKASYIQKPFRDERQADKLAVEQRIREVELYLIDVFGVPMSDYKLIEVCGKVNLVRFTPREQFDPIIPIVFPYKKKSFGHEMKIIHNIKRLTEWYQQVELADKVPNFSWGYWTRQIKNSANTLLEIFSDELNDAEYEQYYNWLGDILRTR